MSRVRVRVGLAGAIAIGALAFATAPAQAALECGDVITRDRTLNKDLVCGPGSDALYIGTSGITLDLDGHKIEGSGTATAAVRVVGAENTKVLDGRIRGFANAVFVDTADDLTVRGLDIRGADDESIALTAVNDASITHNLIRGSEEGYHVEASGASSRVRIAANEMIGGGIELTDGNRFTAVGNEIRGSAEEGVIVGFAGNTDIIRNAITGSSLAGVALTPDAAAVRVHDNLVERAGGGGIVASSAAGLARVTGNTVLDVDFNGFYVGNTAAVILRGNVAKRANGGDGIHVEDDDTLIEDNRVINNDQHGIESSSANGSGNVAKRNGVVPQCMPVSLCG